MFSAQQLQNFAGKKRITQETFDDAVRENIEEFDMEVSPRSPSDHNAKASLYEAAGWLYSLA